MADSTEGTIRVRWWSNKQSRGGVSSGYGVIGLDQAPNEALIQARNAIETELIKRTPTVTAESHDGKHVSTAGRPT